MFIKIFVIEQLLILSIILLIKAALNIRALNIGFNFFLVE